MSNPFVIGFCFSVWLCLQKVLRAVLGGWLRQILTATAEKHPEKHARDLLASLDLKKLLGADYDAFAFLSEVRTLSSLIHPATQTNKQATTQANKSNNQSSLSAPFSTVLPPHVCVV